MDAVAIRTEAVAESRVCFGEAELAPGPVDVRTAFGLGRPADLDIGFGKGRSLAEWALARRDGMLLGIEKRKGFVGRALERLDAAARLRVRIVHGDARAVLPRLRPAGFFRSCAMSFPDPWWKRRHMKRQVVGTPLAEEIARLLGPGGEMFLQTDVEERAAQFRSAFAGCGRFDDISGPGGFLPANPTGIRSNREIRYAETGVPVFRMLFRKR